MYFSKSENLSFPNANQKKHLRPEFTKRHSMTMFRASMAIFWQARRATALYSAKLRQGPGLWDFASHGGPDVEREKWVGGL